MKIEVKVLKKGDSVINIWDGHIAVQRKNGDAEIIQYYLDEAGLPRIGGNVMVITQGNGEVVVSGDSSAKVSTF